MQWFIDKALIWYYFNILMISAIIVGVLLISINRAKAVMINTGERHSSLDSSRKLPPTVKWVAVYGLVFFTLREYGNDLILFAKNIYEWAGGLIG